MIGAGEDNIFYKAGKDRQDNSMCTTKKYANDHRNKTFRGCGVITLAVLWRFVVMLFDGMQSVDGASPHQMDSVFDLFSTN